MAVTKGRQMLSDAFKSKKKKHKGLIPNENRTEGSAYKSKKKAKKGVMCKKHKKAACKSCKV